MRTFEQVFSAPSSVEATAPGRVNLLGEHTDYNDGYVLPTAIPQRTRVALRRREAGAFRVYSAQLDAITTFTHEQPPAEHFAQYVYGCVRELSAKGIAIPPLDMYIDSQVPIGIGVSSSAALEVATLRAMRALLQLSLDDKTIALLGQRAEIEYAHVNVGIMDQFASSLADTQHMLFLDTRTLEYRLFSLPSGSEILVLDSGVRRSLANSEYNARRGECEAAARQLGVPALRDVSDVSAVESLSEPQRRRARHVVSENARVLEVTQGVGAETFGQLMDASHASLRNDFEVSVPPLDHLVRLLQNDADVFGARLTGAGFGGACVALCRAGTRLDVAERVLPRYAASGQRGRTIVPREVVS
jgi:galactokinase